MPHGCKATGILLPQCCRQGGCPFHCHCTSRVLPEGSRAPRWSPTCSFFPLNLAHVHHVILPKMKLEAGHFCLAFLQHPCPCCPVNDKLLTLVSGLQKPGPKPSLCFCFMPFPPHLTPTAPWKCLMVYPLCAFVYLILSDSLQSCKSNLTTLLFGLKFSNGFPLHLLENRNFQTGLQSFM